MRLLLKAVLSIGILRIYSMLLALGVSILLARHLGPSEYGRYALTMSTVTLAALPIGVALQRFIARETAASSPNSRYEEGGAYCNWGLRFALTYSAIVMGVFLGLSHAFPILGSQKWAALGIALALLPLKGLISIYVGLMKGLKKPFKSELIVQLGVPSIFLSLLWYISANGLLDSAESAIIMNLSATLAAILAFAPKMTPGKAIQGLKDFGKKEQLRRVFPLMLIALATTTNTHIALLMLGLLGDLSSVAGMRIAERGGQMLLLPLALANSVMLPYIVESWKENDSRAIADISKKTARLSLAICVPATAVLFLFGELFISTIFGPEFVEQTYLPLLTLSIGCLVGSFFGSVGYILTLTNNENLVIIASSIALIVNIVLCFALIPRFGALGSAIAVASSQAILNISMAGFVFMRFRIVSTPC